MRRDPGTNGPVRLADVPAEPLGDRATISGSTENATSASRQSIQISTPMMPTSVNRSPKTETTPDVNSSFSTSTSVVTRVISRPTGLRS